MYRLCIPQYDSKIMGNNKDLNIDLKLEKRTTLLGERKRHQFFKEYTKGLQGDYQLTVIINSVTYNNVIEK